jgi:glycosyltransferase involved in cell wall biosynthesis
MTSGTAASSASLRTIGLNLLYLVPGKVGGTEVYARRLVHALAQAHPRWRWVVYCGTDARAGLESEYWPDTVRIVSAPRPSRDKASRAALELSWLAWRAASDHLHLLHSLGTTSPLTTSCPRIVTVHDLIYLHYPETFPQVARFALRRLVGPGARRADRVIADSQAGKDDIVAHLRVRSERIDVVHLGANITRVEPASEAEVRARYGIRDRKVCLCVSAALVHKNLDALIEAFGRIAGAREDLVLVIAGHAGREGDRLRAAAGRTGHADRILLTGWISDEDLEALYALATCCVYPSLHEGFGLPVLEAMARGVPLACADASSLPEVAGDAADLFDGRDTAAIGRAIEKLLDDRAHAQMLVERGLERVRQFTWERCAASTLESYERALLRGERR